MWKPLFNTVELSYAPGVVSGTVSSPPTSWSPWTVCAASSISSAAALGREIIEGCDARTSTMCALARWAMKSCANGGITLSSVPSEYQASIAFPVLAYLYGSFRILRSTKNNETHKYDLFPR